MLEFKPKWLAPSPVAPPSATRCRNCARAAQKWDDDGNTDTPPPHCALDFFRCASDPDALARTLDALATPTDDGPARARLAHWLATDALRLLARLRDLQVSHDPRGPPAAETHDPAFQLAMTLRDCSCFVRIPAEPDQPVVAKLADFDKKNWEAKLAYWLATERELIEGGFYEGREVPRRTTNCLLERATPKSI